MLTHFTCTGAGVCTLNKYTLPAKQMTHCDAGDMGDILFAFAARISSRSVSELSISVVSPSSTTVGTCGSSVSERRIGNSGWREPNAVCFLRVARLHFTFIQCVHARPHIHDNYRLPYVDR
jgi:hypothetical protein